MLIASVASLNIYDAFISGNHGIDADVIFQNLDVIGHVVEELAFDEGVLLGEEWMLELDGGEWDLYADDDPSNRTSCVSCKV